MLSKSFTILLIFQYQQMTFLKIRITMTQMATTKTVIRIVWPAPIPNMENSSFIIKYLHTLCGDSIPLKKWEGYFILLQC